MSYFTESFKTLLADKDDIYFSRDNKLPLGDDNLYIDDYQSLKNIPELNQLKVGGSYLAKSRKHFDEHFEISNAKKLMVYMLSKNNSKNFAWSDLKTWSRNMRIKDIVEKAAYMDSPKGLKYFDTMTVDFLLNVFPHKSKGQLYLPILITFDSNKIYYVHAFKNAFCKGQTPQIDIMDLKDMIEFKKK